MQAQLTQPAYDPNAVLAKAGPRRTGDVALKLFFRITDEWGLTRTQQQVLLGAPARTTFFKWQREGGEVPRDTLERISYIAGIASALQILLPAGHDRFWVTRPNTDFGGQPPLQRMLAGNVADLASVRFYLDAKRGW